MEKKMFKGLIASMVFMYMATTIGVFVDGVIIGSYFGEEAMASYGLATPLIAILLAVADIFSSGGQNVCAAEMGKGNMKKANQTFSAVIVTIAAIGIVIGFAIYFGTTPLCKLLGAKGSGAVLYRDLADYLKGFAFAVPAMLLALVITMIQQLEGYMLPTIVGVITMTVVNIVLDLVVAKVLDGTMFEMALATTISYYCGLAVLLLGFLKKDISFRISFRKLKFKSIKQVITIGIPGALEKIFYAIRGMVYNKILLLVCTTVAIGTMAVASYSIYTTLNNLFGSVCFGVESATLMVVGVLFGEENKPALKRLVRSALKWVVILTTAAGAILFIISPYVVKFFSDDAETIDMAVKCVRIFSLSMPFTGANAVLKKFLQGTRRTALTNLYCLVEIVIITSAVGLALGYSFGVYGVFYGYLMAESIMLAIYFILCASNKRFEGLLFLPKHFDAPPQDIYEGTLSTVDEVAEVSKKSSQFCEKHGADSKRTMTISRCIEEIANSILTHGFSDGKEHHMEFRLVYKNDIFTLRFRDDCKKFGPTELAKEKDLKNEKGEDIYEKHIKRSILEGVVKDFQYVNSISTNNIIIKV